MKALKKLAAAVAVSTGLVGASGVMAAEDGALTEDSSVGRFDVRLVKDTDVEIWGLEDLVFTDQDLTESQDVCLFSDSGRVALAISSANTKPFTVTNNAGSDATSYPYTLTISGTNMRAGDAYEDDINTPAPTDYQPEIWGKEDDHNKSGAESKFPIIATKSSANGATCTGGNRLNVSVNILALATGQTFAAGTHTDTITMTVTPQ